MPINKPYRRPRPFRKKRFFKKKIAYRQKMAKLARPLRPSVMRFKRDIEQTLALSGSTAPEGWHLDGTNRIYTTLGWSLSSLPENIDFVSLFRQYRIKGARVKLYFSNTTSGTEDSSLHANSQLLVRMAPNFRGSEDLLGNAYWQQIQAKKYRTAINGGKPLDIYMPLKQPTEVKTSTGTGYSLRYPGWLNTAQGNVVHYGLNMSIERVDGQGFTNGYANTQYCKVITTLYLECRGVA